MHTLRSTAIAAAVTGLLITACGGDGNGPDLVSFIVNQGAIAAWADPTRKVYNFLPMGSYAGKRQFLRGNVDPLSGVDLGQPAGADIYKGSDGHIYALDLTVRKTPAAQQLSAESAATIDDTCTFNGTQVAGADDGYVGVYFAPDLAAPQNSSYIYRLPGADGVCNTSDDLIHMVKTGMSATDLPIATDAMPVATVYSDAGAITGFVAKNGNDLLMYDPAMSHPVVLASYASPIGVVVALPNGLTTGYASGQLMLVDGNIVYVDFRAGTVSATLYQIPNWTPTATAAVFAASPTTLYMAVNLPVSGQTPATAYVESMPADGSAVPTVMNSQLGRVAEMQFPVASSNLYIGVVDQFYSILAVPQSGSPASVLLSSSQNNGRFTATAAAVYYSSWFQTVANQVVVHSGTQSGIVRADGTVAQAAQANSMFLFGGEAVPWADGDTQTKRSAYITMFQVSGLSPVQVTDPETGRIVIADGVAGGTLRSIDAGTNQPIVTVGTVPTGMATLLQATYRGHNHLGFVEASSFASTQSPATRDVYLIDSNRANSLVRVTNNL